MNRKFPIEIKNGSVRVKIYLEHNGRGYRRYSVVYYRHGARETVARASFEQAVKVGKAIAGSLSQGQTDGVWLTGLDRLAYIRAKSAVDSLGILLDIAAIQFAEAQKLLGCRGDLVPAVLSKAGVESKHNGLRHSYGSYRTAILKDISAVAHEMGNSKSMIQKHYLEVVYPEQAQRWFSIVPPGDTKVIPLPGPAPSSGNTELWA